MKLRIFIIFALITLAFSCEETCLEKISKCKPMAISNASPVQFWPVNCETWNEQSPAGVHHYCFCHPWQCDDQINLQFSDYTQLYALRILNEADALISQIDFNSTVDESSQGDPVVLDLSTFSNQDIPVAPGGVPWTLGSTPYVNVSNFEYTQRLKKSYSLPAGRYRIFLYATIPASIESINPSFLSFIDDAYDGNPDNSLEIASTPLQNGINEIDIEIPEIPNLVDGGFYSVNSIWFQFSTGENGEGMVKIHSMQIIPLGVKSIYSLSFTPSDYGICDQEVSLRIIRKGDSYDYLTISPLEEWVNVDTQPSAPPWVVGVPVPFVNIYYPENTADDISGSVEAASGGTFLINYNLDLIELSGGFIGAFIHISLWKDGSMLVSDSDPIELPYGTKTGSIELTTVDAPDEIRVRIVSDLEEDGSVQIGLNSVTPEDIPDTDVYKSDCLDIKTLHAETLLINYSNHEDFDGIEYADTSPEVSFNLRIPAVFFENRPIQEGQDDKLSNGQVISLYQESKWQRLLSTDRMPDYMHKKILAVLQHQFLYIDGSYWIKGGEEYAKTEKKNKRDSFAMYTCWLTEQSSLVRNIL